MGEKLSSCEGDDDHFAATAEEFEVERSFNLIMWSKILDLLKRASVQAVLIPIMLFDFFLNVTTCPPPMIERLPGVNQNKIFLESSLVLQSVLVVKNKESFNVLSLKRQSSRVKYSDTRLNVNCEIDLGWKGLVSVKDTSRSISNVGYLHHKSYLPYELCSARLKMRITLHQF